MSTLVTWIILGCLCELELSELNCNFAIILHMGSIIPLDLFLSIYLIYSNPTDATKTVPFQKWIWEWNSRLRAVASDPKPVDASSDVEHEQQQQQPRTTISTTATTTSPSGG